MHTPRTYGILGTIALIAAALTNAAHSQPTPPGGVNPLCKYRIIPGLDNSYNSAHNCCTFGCAENLWTNEAATDDYCQTLIIPAADALKNCGTLLSYSKLVTWYYGGTCTGCQCVKDGTTEIQTTLPQTYQRFSASSPC